MCKVPVTQIWVSGLHGLSVWVRCDAVWLTSVVVLPLPSQQMCWCFGWVGGHRVVVSRPAIAGQRHRRNWTRTKWCQHHRNWARTQLGQHHRNWARTKLGQHHRNWARTKLGQHHRNWARTKLGQHHRNWTGTKQWQHHRNWTRTKRCHHHKNWTSTRWWQHHRDWNRTKWCCGQQTCHCSLEWDGSRETISWVAPEGLWSEQLKGWLPESTVSCYISSDDTYLWHPAHDFPISSLVTFFTLKRVQEYWHRNVFPLNVSSWLTHLAPDQPRPFLYKIPCEG